MNQSVMVGDCWDFHSLGIMILAAVRRKEIRLSRRVDIGKGIIKRRREARSFESFIPVILCITSIILIQKG